MNDQELESLRERLKYAVSNGFGVARSDAYAAELTALGATAPDGEASAADLLAMVESVLSGDAKKSKASSKAAKQAAKEEAEAAKAEADAEAAKAKAEAAAKEEAAETPKDEPKAKSKPSAR